MEGTSDTESDISCPRSPNTQRQYAFIHEHSSPDLDSVDFSFHAVQSAIQILNEQDATSLGDVNWSQEAYKLVLQFLDCVPQLLRTDCVSEVLQTFSQLGNLSFLQHLLELRKCLRLAAHRMQSPGSRTAIVTWVDIVLAKLSLVVTPIAVGSAVCDLASDGDAEWVQVRREGDAIRAATQLPDNWAAINAVIESNDFSPAARRLATSLAFMAYVMIRQISSDEMWPKDSRPPLEILQSLYLAVNQAACSTISPSLSRRSFLDRIQLAMLISLFANVHASMAELEGTTSMSQLRPEGFGHLLELMQIIICQNKSSFFILETLDSAQCILVRWGNVVPWSWSIWNDQLVANTECLRTLSATWFFSLSTPLYGTRHKTLDQKVFGIDFQGALLKDVLSSVLMILQLFKELLNNKYRESLPTSVAMDILCKLSWAAVQYLESYVIDPDPQLEMQIPELCKSLLLIFPTIEFHGGEDNLARSLIIEALTLVPSGLVSSTLKKICQTKDMQFLSRLDGAMRTCITYHVVLYHCDGVYLTPFIRLLSGEGTSESDPEARNDFAKSLLNFSTFLTQPTLEDSNLRGMVFPFINRVSQVLVSSGPDSSLCKVILGSLLMAISGLRSRKSGLKIGEDDIWVLTMHNMSRQLSVTAAFTHYLLSTTDRCRDSLLRHEAWNYLLSVLNKILERQLPEEEEPLGLLISPNICHALRSIPSNETNTKHLLSSPWTLTIRLSMEEVLNDETPNNSYFKLLQDRLRSPGLRLLNGVFGGHAKVPSDTPPSQDAFKRMFRLVYHRDYCGSELVPVYDIDDVLLVDPLL